MLQLYMMNKVSKAHTAMLANNSMSKAKTAMCANNSMSRYAC